jgi:hypothetical protein
LLKWVKKVTTMTIKILCILALLSAPALLNVRGVAAEATQPSFAQLREKLQSLATHSNSQAAIALKDGRRLEGQVKEVRSEEFVIRNRQKRETTVAFRDVERIEQPESRTLEKGVAISIAAGLGALLAFILGMRLRFEK